MLVFGDADAYHRFRTESRRRSAVEICYCSTLDECWMYAADDPAAQAIQKPVDTCPVLPDTEAFGD